jgi:hypothetical protein
MAKYGPGNFTVTVDDSGGTARNISPHVRAIGNIEVEDLVAQSNSFGDTFEEWTPVGVRKGAPFTISGYFDDVGTLGPDLIFNQAILTPASSTRTVLLAFGGSKTWSAECIITKYVRTPVTDSLTGYEATLQPTGTITEA